MADPDGRRPQDVGRRHRRAGVPGPETSSLLARYQATMRQALERTIDRIEAKPPATPDGTLGLAAPLSARDEAAAWDLAIKLARELATSIDPPVDSPGLGERAGRVGAGPTKRGRGLELE